MAEVPDLPDDDLTTPEGRLGILLRETFPWSAEASTMACQTIRGLLEERLPATDAENRARDLLKALKDNSSYGDAGQFYPGMDLVEEVVTDLLKDRAPAAGVKELEEARAAMKVVDYELRTHDGGTYRVEYPEVDRALRALHALLQIPSVPAAGQDDTEFLERITRIADEVTLAENFAVVIDRDPEHTPGRWYFQIRCWRKDVITGEMGYGYGGKAYLSPHATDSELVQTIFGLYNAYWHHEARETFQWRDRRVFGPHIATEALHSVAHKVDVRSAKHVEDRRG